VIRQIGPHLVFCAGAWWDGGTGFADPSVYDSDARRGWTAFLRDPTAGTRINTWSYGDALASKGTRRKAGFPFVHCGLAQGRHPEFLIRDFRQPDINTSAGEPATSHEPARGLQFEGDRLNLPYRPLPPAPMPTQFLEDRGVAP